MPLVARVTPRLGSSEVPQTVPPSRCLIDEAIFRLNVRIVVVDIERVPFPTLRLRVEEEDVMDSAVKGPASLRVTMRRGPLPADLIAKVARTENLIAHDLKIVADVRRTVEIQ